ncbi:riboflavin synthase subunit alpha [Methylopila jiangsuensis]|uniref:Riboflavin synthase n=1 Tax=Methylopila jiangsuensis TaxID=586230 RepID=A0A9W6JIA7_9HYPH|nr:riboflavin synthase [Methylopila jiangsuensis]MDR6284143.1 riboflavin synthase [Methylopila jiangsuensis]GLK76340.1 riboflavin synthase subunit alpha [Methylopila jiangsuensis]
MFTGIVTDVGEIVAREAEDEVIRLVVAARYEAAGIALGASIACDGVCLTVTAVEPEGAGCRFTVQAGPETLALTTVGGWAVGRRINLERALRIGDELGGHVVLGHVDGVAEITAREDGPETARFIFEAPAEIARFVAVKGSVCLDGTSLTVNTVEGRRFSVHLIPHTLKETTWGGRGVGDRVNIEADMMARYAARLAEARDLGY